jgi:hypothetical protein
MMRAHVIADNASRLKPATSLAPPRRSNDNRRRFSNGTRRTNMPERDPAEWST